MSFVETVFGPTSDVVGKSRETRLTFPGVVWRCALTIVSQRNEKLGVRPCIYKRKKRVSARYASGKLLDRERNARTRDRFFWTLAKRSRR